MSAGQAVRERSVMGLDTASSGKVGSGKARQVAVGQGSAGGAWKGKARREAARPTLARLDTARQARLVGPRHGTTCCGKARHDPARSGTAGVFRHGKSPHGELILGWVRQVGHVPSRYRKVRLAGIRHGSQGLASWASQGWAGFAWRGSSGHGLPGHRRQGTTRLASLSRGIVGAAGRASLDTFGFVTEWQAPASQVQNKQQRVDLARPRAA